MDATTFDETLLAFKRRTPFRPFTVALVNGERYEIDEPDALGVREGFAAYLSPEMVPVFFEPHAVSQIIGDLAMK